MTPVPVEQRIDQWLWFARIAKTRTLAQALIERGKVRLNKAKIAKASQTVKNGDVITITLGPRVRVLEVAAAGTRRGPAPEAAQLYRELTPPPEAPNSGAAAVTEAYVPPSREKGAGRPTKRERRQIDRFKAGNM